MLDLATRNIEPAQGLGVAKRQRYLYRHPLGIEDFLSVFSPCRGTSCTTCLPGVRQSVSQSVIAAASGPEPLLESP